MLLPWWVTHLVIIIIDILESAEDTFGFTWMKMIPRLKTPHQELDLRVSSWTRPLSSQQGLAQHLWRLRKSTLIRILQSKSQARKLAEFRVHPGTDTLIPDPEIKLRFVASTFAVVRKAQIPAFHSKRQSVEDHTDSLTQ